MVNITCFLWFHFSMRYSNSVIIWEFQLNLMRLNKEDTFRTGGKSKRVLELISITCDYPTLVNENKKGLFSRPKVYIGKGIFWNLYWNGPLNVGCLVFMCTMCFLIDLILCLCLFRANLFVNVWTFLVHFPFSVDYMMDNLAAKIKLLIDHFSK